MFSGSTQLYIKDKFKRFESIHQGKERKVKGRLGDLPAIKHTLRKKGLHTLVYQSTGSIISYPNWEKFQSFTTNEGVEWAQQAHLDRGLPKEDFKESFVRYAKSLVTWKGNQGSDSVTDMPFEIVALNNPYLDHVSTLKVKVLWQGQPYEDGQLTIFKKAKDIATERSILLLDERGTAEVPLTQGFSYLLNSVLMEPIDGGKNTPVWRSHWASMTFEIPPQTK